MFDGGAAGGDAGFAVHGAAIFEECDEVNVGKGGRKNAAADGQDFAADADGFGKIASDMSERGEEKITEIMTDEAAAGVETILEEATEKRFVFGKSDHAIANVAGREDAIFTSQAAGAAAVIGDGNDGGKVGDGTVEGGTIVATADDVLLKAAQQGGQASATAKSDNAKAASR